MFGLESVTFFTAVGVGLVERGFAILGCVLEAVALFGITAPTQVQACIQQLTRRTIWRPSQDATTWKEVDMGSQSYRTGPESSRSIFVVACAVFGLWATALAQAHIQDRHQFKLLLFGITMGVSTSIWREHNNERDIIGSACAGIWSAQVLSIILHKLIPRWREPRLLELCEDDEKDTGGTGKEFGT